MKTNIMPLAALASAATLAFAGQAHAAAIAHWSFDTNGDDSVGSNDLTAQSAAVTFGNSGGAFGGFMDDTSSAADAYALMTSTIVLKDGAGADADTDGWAVAFWLRNWSFNAVVMGANTDNNSNKLYTRDNVTSPRIQIRDIGVQITATDASVVITDWTHFAVVREGDGTSNLYIDGTVYAGDPGTQTLDWTINSLGYGGGGNGLNGDLDEVWIFDTALTSTEVNSLRTSNSIPEPSAVLLGGIGALVFLRRRR